MLNTCTGEGRTGTIGIVGAGTPGIVIIGPTGTPGIATIGPTGIPRIAGVGATDSAAVDRLSPNGPAQPSVGLAFGGCLVSRWRFCWCRVSIFLDCKAASASECPDRRPKRGSHRPPSDLKCEAHTPASLRRSNASSIVLKARPCLRPSTRDPRNGAEKNTDIRLRRSGLR